MKSSKNRKTNPKELRQKAYKKISMFLDFLFTVPGHVVFAFLLLFAIIFMFINSTRVSSPELREYALTVDKRTSSPKDTLTVIFIECIFDADSLFCKGEYIEAYKSALAYNLAYKLHEIPENEMNSNGLQVPRKIIQKGTGKILMEYKYFKQLIVSAFGMPIQDEQYISYPDSLTQMLVTNIRDQKNLLLCRTVPYGEMQMTVYSKDGLINSHHKHNPYITTYFRFNFKNDVIDLDEKSRIIINNGSKRGKTNELKTPINYLNIWPTPDKVAPDCIEYNTIESITNAINNGIYISAENLTMRKLSDRNTFLYTLFLGVFATMFIDLIISLVRKWKNYMHKYNNNI